MGWLDYSRGLNLIELFQVVTGATDGIGKAFVYEIARMVATRSVNCSHFSFRILT